MAYFNPLEELPIIINNIFTIDGFKIFCQTYEAELPTSFDDLTQNGLSHSDQVKKFIITLMKMKKLGAFVRLLAEKKNGLPDVEQFKLNWDNIFETNQEGKDQFNNKAFDLFFFSDNNQNFPFIGRDDFKENIRQAINSQSLSSLRLLINGVQGIGVSYLRQYLTQLHKHHNCFKKFIIIDCKIDLDMDTSQEVQPVHIAESMLYKLKITNIPEHIDVEDPAKFKTRYHARFFDIIKEECEKEKEGIVIFIDHLHHNMNSEVFAFLNLFLDKLKEFTIPYMLVMGGLTTEQINFSLVKEITLESFNTDEFRSFFAKIYSHLKTSNPESFEDLEEAEFVEGALKVFGNSEEDGEEIPNVKDIQADVKLWYEGLLDEILEKSEST